MTKTNHFPFASLGINKAVKNDVIIRHYVLFSYTWDFFRKKERKEGRKHIQPN